MEDESAEDPAWQIVQEVLAESKGGRPVTDAERLSAFKRLAESGSLQTLVPLLPLLLNLDSKPYTLERHYQFEPFFRTKRPRKTLLITGRQVAKTTYEAADGVVQSNCIPNFKTLYVTPLFEQARRLSTDRVRKFIDQSPVRHLWCNSKTENSVLRKTFSNGSVMHFSFALLDADRTRGISADKICYDESFRSGTPVSTPTGSAGIESLRSGDAVLGFDENGQACQDEVVSCSDHGVRDCYRIELSGGSYVEATSDSWVATTSGWRRLETVVTDLGAGGLAPRDLEQVSSAHRPARLQLPKVPGVVRVRSYASQESEERRLRGVVEFVRDTNLAGALPYRLLVRPQEGHGGHPETLVPEEVVRVTWTGRHRVWDIETAKHGTFFAGGVAVHNCQDMDRSNIPVINECMSHSKWKLVQFAGTPKTPENTISGLFNQSSQAEWFIPCRACKHENICNTDWHLDKITGPRWDPGEGKPFLGTVCARCDRMIDPADGFWVHRFPDRRWDFAGYHIPQQIMHVHYSDPQAWGELLGKREGAGNYTPARFFNEVQGEACGTGIQLISMRDLGAASDLPWDNDPRDYSKAVKQAQKYHTRLLAVDWGGGGEEAVSLTTVAVLGFLSSGQVHVLWGRRLMTPHDHVGEAAFCLEVFRAFRCQLLAHDYSGAGSLRETFLVHNQPDMLAKIVPVAYIGAATKSVITFKPATDAHPRNHYLVDKTRSLLLTCASIKMRKVRFFRPDYKNPDDPGLTHDFLGLVENKTPTSRGGDIYTIQRHAQLSDDFAQAVNIGCVTLWHANNAWPVLTGIRDVAITEQQMRSAVPQPDADWDRDDGDVGPMGVPR